MPTDFHRHFHSLSTLLMPKLFQNVRYFVRHSDPLHARLNEEQSERCSSETDVRITAVSAALSAIAVAVVSIINSVAVGTLAVGTMTCVIGAIRELQKFCRAFFLSLGNQYQNSLFVTKLFEVMDTCLAIHRQQNARVLSAAARPRSSWTMCHLFIPKPTSWS